MEVHVWPDFGAPEDVEFALIWGPYASEMKQFPNLKAMISLGAGVDHILDQVDRPPHVPVARLVDPGLKIGMVEYVVYNVLRFHRRMPDYRQQQEKQLWIERYQTLPSERRVGILGLGEIGVACAQALIALGFDVLGWSRTKKDIHKVGCFYGDEALKAFLGQSEILICLLPLTPETNGILGKIHLAALPAGAYLINAGRGAHVIEADLLEALGSGHIAGAALDVFQTEPLPKGHPLWSHANVTVTPHIAALTLPTTAGPVIADIVHAAQAGKPIPHRVNAKRGY
ncbi:MAG: glyoxylate/hydroxypyruvate reductase A [Rhodospirillaceae bacterium]|nr:glyoxylate/hydroxypyruvate reductase A [Rhodospirillaceae bacterium]MBT5457437.1 glyoxylate/hydroxypyruvate reductase A [Rhodospirillaceae bacterium]